MSQAAQEVDSKSATATAAPPLGMLGVYQVPFTFSQSSTSTRTVSSTLQNVPEGTKAATIAMQAFNVDYTNHEHYDFGQLQVSMVLINLSTASCTITLRDNNVNERQWEGTAAGIVTFYGV